MNHFNKQEIGKAAKLIKDFIWNIMATILGTAVLQLVVYPLLARWLDLAVYGQILTIMGIANIVVVSLGGGLNNARLIQEEKYSKERSGDFNFLLGVVSIIGTILLTLVLLIIFPVTVGTVITIVAYAFFGILRGYWSVGYRIKINYVANFKMNVFITFGYFVGIFLVKITNIWALSFLIAEVFGVLYLWKTTDLYKESRTCTALFKDTTKILLILVFNTLIVNVITYLDRLLLYPMLGGEQVSVFTVSSFVGKSAGLLMTPIAGVLLSYYAQKTFKMTVKRFWRINIGMIALAFLSGGVLIILGPWITGFLYPSLIEKALPYIAIANSAALVGVLANIIMPAVLKYADIQWQLVIQIIYIILYLGIGVLLLNRGGIFGFCLANLVVNSIRVIALLVIGHYGVKRFSKEWMVCKEKV